MALSDFIRKIEDSPRSIKVTVGIAVGVAAAAVVAALVVVISQPDYGPEPASPPAVAIVVTATPAAQSSFIPSPTPQPTSTSTPPPTPTPEPQPEEPTPLPTETPLPTATPTPEVNDYYVVLYRGKNKDGRGGIQFYASYEGVVPKGLTEFNKDDELLSYLVRESVMTSKQKEAYFKGERIPVPLLDISNAVYKMIQKEGIFKFREYFSRLSDVSKYRLTHYADKSSSGSNGSVLGGNISLEGSEGYVTISDGKIGVSAVDDDGTTTTVNVEGVGAKELLDYWLSQNKITIEQKNQYGQTGKIQFSLKDGVDLLDFEVSLDSGGSVGIDKDVRDRIVNEILPLFSSD